MMDVRDMKIDKTSMLYETKPMYLEDQVNFTNAVCRVSLTVSRMAEDRADELKISTNLDPQELLQRLKGIEHELGRVKTIDNGPRPIDLDILLYDDKIIDLKDLKVPHPRIMEREFVLKPLCE